MTRDSGMLKTLRAAVELLINTLVRRQEHRVIGKPEKDHDRLDRRHAFQRRIETRVVTQAKPVDDLFSDIARAHHLHLARHSAIINAWNTVTLLNFRPREGSFLRFDQNLRFGFVFWRGGLGVKVDQPSNPQDEKQHAELGRPKAGQQVGKIDFLGCLRLRGRQRFTPRVRIDTEQLPAM
jgi:hypothetical protein